MQTVNIPLYQFKELSKDAQKDALTQQRYINVNGGYWYKSIYLDFCCFCLEMGILVDFKHISFRGFYLQGDGSAFESMVDVISLIHGVKAKRWMDYAPKTALKFSKLPVNQKVIKLIENGSISCFATTQRLSSNYMRVNVDFDYKSDFVKKNSRIDDQLILLEKWIEETLMVINKYLYKSLQHKYEELLSDQAIKESIEANDYLFTVHGTHADNLFSLANYI